MDGTQVLVRRYICVPQNICFSFQIFQANFDDIPNADNADKPAIGHHEQMSYVVIPHQAQGPV
jgi:hypothetical protein